MGGREEARFHFVPDADWSFALSPAPSIPSSSGSAAGAPLKHAATRDSPSSAPSQEKENAPASTPQRTSPASKRVKVTSSASSSSSSSSSHAPMPMRARWAQKSNDELRAKHAQLVALRHTSMLQRAALACGDDLIDDSPEFLKLQERSCTARLVEIEAELGARNVPVPSTPSGDDAPDVSVDSAASDAYASPLGTAPSGSGRRTASASSVARVTSIAPSAETPAPAARTPLVPLRSIQPTADDADEVQIVETRPAAQRTPPAAAPPPHAWDAQVQHALRRLFRLSQFRPDQLEAINATLSGQDVFCLMPTGGGKSLCYQLPATVTQGATDGLTVVISPLIALIHNQVKNLLRLEIPTLAITGDMAEEDRRFACAELYKRDLNVRLLYVTPEFVCNSRLASSILSHLYTGGRLARFVIDEAHCVDQWGHDFRPDYVRLEMLRQQYPTVPLMALTATARIDTVQDIQRRLGMRDALVLRQSFNRPNLTYSVVPKRRGAATLDSIAAFIRTHHPNDCGIIYCLSRRDCENLASDLETKYGIHARHFHAGLDTQDKLRIQDTWETGHFKVIVATIAFGMGIDKADVRFVIHHSIPKSLEGYYQETGRAGRDGKRSECVLYWTMDDARKLEGMINDSEDASLQQKHHQLQKLRQVTAFCQALTECRRTNILKYFGERFDPAHCHASCDNCRRGAVQTVDVTTPAKDFVNMVQLMGAGRHTHLTKAYYTSVFKGSLRKDIKDKGHHRNLYHGRGARFSDEELKRIVDHLLNRQYLQEYARKAAYQRFPNHYLKPGPEAPALLTGDARVELEMADAPARAPARREAPATPEPDEFDIATMPLSPTELAMLDAPPSPVRRPRAAGSAGAERPAPPERAPRAQAPPGGRRAAIAPMPMGFIRRG